MGVHNVLIEGVSGTGKTSVCHELRPADEFGSRPEERELVLQLHATGEDLTADGVGIDASAPVSAASRRPTG